MRENPYEPVAFRGNPNRIRGLLSMVKMITKRTKERDGDVLEIILQEYAEWARGTRQRPSSPDDTKAEVEADLRPSD